MEEGLISQIQADLEASKLKPPERELVEAACLGLLDAVLEGRSLPRPERGTLGDLADSHAASLAWIEVEGFRGIGPRRKLELTPGPGLTVVLGRNGSGKSSFVEGLEALLRGTSARWEGRTKEWAQGWLNVHHPEGRPVCLRAGLHIEGEGTRVLERRIQDPAAGSFPDGEALFDDGSTLAQRGWPAALESTPPLLSYSELGRLASARPIDLFKALSILLDLGPVDDAIDALGRARKRLEAGHKARKAKAKALLQRLSESEDPRAVKAHQALSPRTWDLETLEALALGLDEEQEAGLSELRKLANLRGPLAQTLAEHREALEDAQERVARAGEGGVARQVELQRLLGLSLELVAPGEDCPVCGSASLGAEWAEQTRARLEALKSATQEQKRAREGLEQALRAARQQIRQAPPVLAGVDKLGLPAGASEAWTAWWALREADAPLLIQELETRGRALTLALATLSQAAAAERDRRQDAWRPLQKELKTFTEGAQQDLADHQRSREVDRARKWLVEQRKVLQARRFEPISEAAQQTWARLRKGSSLSLDALEISGSGNKAAVTLKASVDDAEAPALGVMSQGELNAMGLALFLPRAMAEASPFRFLVIDDPVQAMDPHKVDGLAELLSELAATRQVVVFTHDTRLQDALQRLQIPAEILEVQRDTGSRVQVSRRRGAVEQAFHDATQVAYAEEKLGAELCNQLVALHCRKAIEAAAVQRIRARALEAGEALPEVEEQIRDCKGTNGLVAWARYGGQQHGNRVLKGLSNKHPSLADAYQQVKAGTHHSFHGSAKEMVRVSRRIAEWVGA